MKIHVYEKPLCFIKVCFLILSICITACQSNPKSKPKKQHLINSEFDCDDLDSLVMYANGDTTILSQLALSGCELMVEMPEPGDDLSLLHLAASKGDVNVAKFLLDHGFSPNAYSADFLYSMMPMPSFPLDYALREKQLDMVKFLIENGASEFHIASVPMIKEYISMLLDIGFDVNKKMMIWAENHENLIRSPRFGDPVAEINLLGLAYIYGDTELTKWLRSKGARLIKTPIFNSFTALCQKKINAPNTYVEFDYGIFDLIERPGGFEWQVEKVAKVSDTLIEMNVSSFAEGATKYYKLAISNYGHINLEVDKAIESFWFFMPSGTYAPSLYIANNGLNGTISGAYINGRYEGNPNFGCSFYFHGNYTDISDEGLKITVYNPFDRSEEPGTGLIRHHGHEQKVTIIIQGMASDCWDDLLGFANISSDPGVTFQQVGNPNDWQGMYFVDTDKTFFHDDMNESTKRKDYVIKGDLLFERALEYMTESDRSDAYLWVKATYIGKNSTTKGWIKRSDVKSLEEVYSINK